MIAIHKPSGLLVHRTRIAAGEAASALAQLRDQIGQWVYPVHRLDRSASGVLIFALSSEIASSLSDQFRKHSIGKTYLAAVRGWPADSGTIDKPVRATKDSEYAHAISHFETLARVELPVPTGRYETSRMALVRVRTETGRMHQVRKHLDSISHPILGDTVYGDGRYNKLIREKYGIHRLLLLGESMSFVHPVSGEGLRIEARPDEEFSRLFGDSFCAPPLA